MPEHQPNASTPKGEQGPGLIPAAGERPARPELIDASRIPESEGPSARARTALWIALAADVVQILLVPAFVEGWFSPANDVLDVVVAVLMFALLGWHPAFLPSFIAELIPVLGLFPSWTVAVLFVTRKRS
jgi:hypothetical protein